MALQMPCCSAAVMPKENAIREYKSTGAEIARYAVASIIKGYVLPGIVVSQKNMKNRNRSIGIHTDGSKDLTL